MGVRNHVNSYFIQSLTFGYIINENKICKSLRAIPTVAAKADPYVLMAAVQQIIPGYPRTKFRTMYLTVQSFVDTKFSADDRFPDTLSTTIKKIEPSKFV